MKVFFFTFVYSYLGVWEVLTHIHMILPEKCFELVLFGRFQFILLFCYWCILVISFRCIKLLAFTFGLNSRRILLQHIRTRTRNWICKQRPISTTASNLQVYQSNKAAEKVCDHFVPCKWTAFTDKGFTKCSFFGVRKSVRTKQALTFVF